MGACGGMWLIFYLILYEKSFLGSGDPACLLDLGVCHLNALVVDVGEAFCGFGGVLHRILLWGFVGN